MKTLSFQVLVARIFFLPFALLLIPLTANAEVVKTASDGFIVQQTVTVHQDKSIVFNAMTNKLGEWWDPSHSFSGDAGNMLIDKECFCERWDENLVRHLNTTIWLEGSKVIMEGGLGPLKDLGLSGTMVWSLATDEDADTTITWKYHVYGFSETDLAELATGVDGVLKGQIDRLVNHLR